MLDKDLADDIQGAAETTKAVIKVTLIASVVINLLLSGILSMILGMINSLQIIIHFPLLSIAMPANSEIVYSALIPIVTFDLLETYGDKLTKVAPFLQAYSSDVEAAEIPQQF